MPTWSSPVYLHGSRLPQEGVGGRIVSPADSSSKIPKENLKLAPVSPENWERYVKDLEELWKKGADARWEDWQVGVEQTLASKKSRNSH